MPNLVLSTPTNPGDANWVDIDALVPPGATITIPDGGSIGGVYEANILCLGSVYITADLQVSGDLIVRGNVYVANPTSIFVQGDFICGTSLIDPDDFVPLGGEIYIINGTFTTVWPSSTYTSWNTTGTSPQKDIVVGGDFLFVTLTFPQTGGAAGSIRVKGDVVGEIDGSSVYDPTNVAPGCYIEINGDYSSKISTGGGGVAVNGVPAGTIYVGGTLSADYINADGLYFAANGGAVGAYSIVCRQLTANGSDSSITSAGNGGYITAVSLEAGITLSANGGSCSSGNAAHSAGQGGSVFVNESVNFNSLTMNGGYRAGSSFGVSFFITQPNGGSISAKTVSGYYFSAQGGSVTGAVKSQNGGNGGNINSDNSLYCETVIVDGGNDGSVQSSPGNGGSVYAQSINVSSLSARPGQAQAAGTSAFSGGTISGIGGVNILYCDISGSSSNFYRAGSAGSLLTSFGDVIITEFNASGGSCGSGNSSDTAGSGGVISIFGNLIAYNMACSAGNRYGNNFSLENQPPPTAGSVTVRGNCVINNSFEAAGCSISTFYPVGVGGAGGSLNVGGNFVYGGFTNFSLSGGASVGANGGNGGTLTVGGQFVSQKSITNLYGGTSTASGSGTPAAAGGAGGSGSVGGGANVLWYDAKSGLGASSLSGGSLLLAGMCTIGTLNMPTTSVIKPLASNSMVMLKVNLMLGKTTFNNTAGTPTADQLANLVDNLFFSSTNGNWYRIAASYGPL